MKLPSMLSGEGKKNSVLRCQNQLYGDRLRYLPVDGCNSIVSLPNYGIRPSIDEKFHGFSASVRDSVGSRTVCGGPGRNFLCCRPYH